MTTPISNNGPFEVETEKPNCLFCGSDQEALYDFLEGWQLVKCRRCNFVFTSPRPTRRSLPKFYDLDYFFGEERFPDGHLETVPINRVLDVEQFVKRRGRVLEVGPAAGSLLNNLRQRGWEVAGVEISSDAVKLAKENFDLDLFCGELRDYKAYKTFDVICMYQTLEHVPDPREVLENATELLKPGGVLIIEVPNLGSWDMRWNPERKRLSYDLPRHLSHFHHNFLNKTFDQLGLDVLQVNKYLAEFLLKWLHRPRTCIRQAEAQFPHSTPGAPVQTGEVPLMRPPIGWKHQIIRILGHIFPGWRVTIIGRKRQP